MQTETPAGKPITALTADQYLKKYLGIRENLQKEVVPKMQKLGISMEAEKDLNTFYTSDINAFIFSRELIERFFKGIDEQGNPQETADYLMVILSAKFEGDVTGKPTIVVAGVNKDDCGTGYNALSITYAADEQPPTQELLAFPGTDDCEPVQFTVQI